MPNKMKFSLSSKLPEVLQATDEAITTALEAIGEQAEGNVADEITRVGAVDTGRLRNSIGSRVVEKTVYVGTNVEYAPYVELGTVKMAKRPYLRPGMENNLREYQDILVEVLKNQMKR
jgi:HK97 gp10 family phage protein